ncbi:MAG: NADH-quinone oxidoreductase subunit NuoK [Candidatus Omnitrophica bacterium]|nr:NADH-quinone oxidoreductase subunit NuoK [Candidatus Omnitrophota bacterium]
MLSHYLIAGGILFTIGAVGVMTRRNIIVILLSIEIMLNAVNLTMVAFSKFAGNVSGQVASLFVIAIAACEVAVGLAVAVLLFRAKNTTDTNSFNLLRW